MPFFPGKTRETENNGSELMLSKGSVEILFSNEIEMGNCNNLKLIEMKVCN